MPASLSDIDVDADASLLVGVYRFGNDKRISAARESICLVPSSHRPCWRPSISQELSSRSRRLSSLWVEPACSRPCFGSELPSGLVITPYEQHKSPMPVASGARNSSQGVRHLARSATFCACTTRSRFRAHSSQSKTSSWHSKASRNCLVDDEDTTCSRAPWELRSCLVLLLLSSFVRRLPCSE